MRPHRGEMYHYGSVLESQLVNLMLPQFWRSAIVISALEDQDGINLSKRLHKIAAKLANSIA